MKNSMDIETTLEIRNGPDYKMYKSLDLSLALKKGQFDYDKSTGLKFILRERFEISTQNSPLNNSLNHYYYDTASNK